MKTDINKLFELVEASISSKSYKNKFTVEERAMIKTIFAFSDIIVTALPEQFEEVYEGCLETERALMN